MTEKKIFQTHRCTRCRKLIHHYEGMTPGDIDVKLSQHARDEGVVSLEEYTNLFELIKVHTNPVMTPAPTPKLSELDWDLLLEELKTMEVK